MVSRVINAKKIWIYEKKAVILRIMKHIRIVSPSGAVSPDFVFGARARLESWGYRVSIGQHALEQYGRFAGRCEDRLADLNEALSDANVDIVLCSRGGYGLQQIVDQVNLPNTTCPLIVGYSDITELHSLLNLHGIPSLHASMCKALTELSDDDAALLAMRAALAGDPTIFHAVPHVQNKRGTVIGKLIGGNLSVLYGLQGTPYALSALIDACEHPPILMLEDISEKHYHIDRMMHNLRLSGVLEKIGGLVLGHWTDCADDDSMRCSLLDTLLDVVVKYDYPIWVNAPFGHVDSNMPLLLGAQYQLSVQEEGVSLMRV
jgi:muramoyltetrapeptide carboxypeptidase